MRTGTSGVRLVLVAIAVGIAAAVLPAVAAAPAHAYGSWIHDSVPVGPGADACSFCHGDGSADNADCTSLCHSGFMVTPGATVDERFTRSCWSCHEPGAATGPLSATSAACTQECHLYTPVFKRYEVAFAHGAEPHLGASPPYGECLDCHATSVTIRDPGDSPHHDGVDSQAPGCTDCHDGVLAGAQQTHGTLACEACHEGMDRPTAPQACSRCHPSATFGAADCLTCHAAQVHDTTPNVGSCTRCHDEGYRQHAGDVACTRCHTNTAKAHHATARPVAKGCRSCHAMRHAGKKVAAARCAGCHRGSTPAFKPRAQHSTTVTKRFVCSGCHAQKLHAKASGAKLTCRTCHKGRYHAGQARVATSVCVKCHSSALRHSGGLRCALCHRSSVHDPTP